MWPLTLIEKFKLQWQLYESCLSLLMHTSAQRRISRKKWGMKPSEVIKARWLNKSQSCIQPQEFTWLPPPKIKTHSKKTEKQIFHFMSESYPSFSHGGRQVKRSVGHAMEKMAWSKNVIDLQMCVKYYRRRKTRVPAKVLGDWSQEDLVKNKSIWLESPPWGAHKYSNKEPKRFHQASVASSGGRVWLQTVTTRGQQHAPHDSSNTLRFTEVENTDCHQFKGTVYIVIS